MSFGPGTLNASEVWVGTTRATEVYLGTQKVWPVYTPVESPWYTPTPGNPGQAILVPWPAGASVVEPIAISGGAGGTGTGVGGNAPAGGGAGRWYSQRQGTTQVPGSEVYSHVKIWIEAAPGSDGVGGGNFNTAAAAGSRIRVSGVRHDGGENIWINGAGGAAGGSPNGRNGGNVDPTFTWSGRTYTVASYGPGAGQGGASSNKNGSNGAAPGGGGQSGDNGGLTGFAGGNGGGCAVKLYWY